MSFHSIAKASQLVKRNRRTLYKDIKNGTLTATLTATGEKRVETAELIRVYGEISHTKATEVTVAMAQQATPDTTDKDQQIHHLKTQITQLEQRLNDKQQHIDHLA